MVRERQRRLLTEHFENGGVQIRLVTLWIASQPALFAILHEAATGEPDLDVPEAAASVINARYLQWPSQTEESQQPLSGPQCSGSHRTLRTVQKVDKSSH